METNKNAWPTMQPTRSDRRTGVRIAAPADLRCTVSGMTSDVRVRNISAGGLAIYALSPVKTRSDQGLTLTYKTMTIVCQVRVAYCFPVEQGRWLVGMMLVDSSVGRTFDDLIDAITGDESPNSGA